MTESFGYIERISQQSKINTSIRRLALIAALILDFRSEEYIERGSKYCGFGCYKLSNQEMPRAYINSQSREKQS
jgi:hypothetical protein